MLLCLVLASLSGCAAKLANPEDFANRAAGGTAGAPGTAGSSGMATAGANTGSGGTAGGTAVATPACATQLLTSTASPNGCSQIGICHGDANGVMSTALDLRTGFESRLINVAAKHMLGGTTCPTGDLLINTQTPADSWLLKKVMMTQGSCGAAMPLGGTIMASDVTCLQTWINALAGR